MWRPILFKVSWDWNRKSLAGIIDVMIDGDHTSIHRLYTKCGQQRKARPYMVNETGWQWLSLALRVPSTKGFRTRLPHQIGIHGNRGSADLVPLRLCGSILHPRWQSTVLQPTLDSTTWWNDFLWDITYLWNLHVSFPKRFSLQAGEIPLILKQTDWIPFCQLD